MLISVVGFGSAVIYNMERLQANTQDIYIQPFTASNAGLDAHATLQRLHNRMLRIILGNDPDTSAQQDAAMLALESDLRKDISTVKAGFPDDTEKITAIEHLLDDWHDARMQLVDLARHGHREQALQQSMGEHARIYSQLETNIDNAVISAQHHVGVLATQAKNISAEITHLAWLFLGALVVSNIAYAIVIIHKAGSILEHDKQTAKKLYESEERLKLALSGADEGTWDLDVPTGRLNFDLQWGEMLDYPTEQARPSHFEDWALLIHPADREHVLKAMHDHIEGWTSEYKVEYPIRTGSGTLRWVAGHGRAVHRDINGKALRVVGITRDITLKKQAEQRIWQLAHSDSLTSLPNRTSFYERLNQSIAQTRRHRQKLALLFLDLDGFKQINDKFGHVTGDSLLREVAERLRENIRGEDSVARTGGDEFIFILHDISDAQGAAIVAEKITHALHQPFVIQGNTCLIGGSIGISIFPDDADEMETLVTRADAAMYKAKETGKNNFQFFAAPAL